MSPEFAVGAVALFFGALVQGSIGFGMALIAAPMLVAIDPSWVPGPLMLAGFPMVLLMGWRERTHLSFEGLGGALAMQTLGIGAGLLLRQRVSAPALGLLVGALVLIAVAVSAAGLHARPGRRSLVLAATVSGFMGATAALPGPALALVHQNVAPERLRAAFVPFFVTGNLLTLGGLWASGVMGWGETRVAVGLVPWVLLGFFASNFVLGSISQTVTRIAVLVVSAVAALSLIARSFG